MLLLVVGIALGVVVTGLLRAWTRYEAASMAAMSEQVEELQGTVAQLTGRIESLEAIAAQDGGRTTEPLEQDSPFESSFESRARKQVSLSRR